MRNKMRGLRAAMVVVVCGSLFAVLALTGCGGSGGNAGQGSAPDAAAEKTSTDATADETSEAAKADKDAQGATEGQPTEAYVIETFAITRTDGMQLTDAYAFDDRGKQESEVYEMVSDEMAYKTGTTISEWDDYGHFTKQAITTEFRDGEVRKADVDVTDLKTNEDGSLASIAMTYSISKDSFEKGEVASQKITQVFEYGNDKQVIRKKDVKTESLDKDGAMVASQTQTQEFDEDGLQTSYHEQYEYADGKKVDTKGNLTWKKDADGKPTSFEFALSQDGESSTVAGDVTVGELGKITQIDNITVDGKNYPTSMTFDYKKIDNPLPNAYEGWKSFSLTDFALM